MAIGGVIRDGKNQEDALRRVEWIQVRQSLGETNQRETSAQRLLLDNDLKNLSTSQVIFDSLGPSLLSDIVGDLLDLLETSCAVHEKNGDYALGLFSSGWCGLMARTSRPCCGVPGDREGLEPGHCCCHESCWSEASRQTMETGLPVDVCCHGGIRLFAIPVHVGKETVGSISVAYGDPPRGPEELKQLGAFHNASVDALREQAEIYGRRPGLLVELAKKRVLFSARLIGELVERKQTEQALRESEEKYSAAVQKAKDGVIIIQHRTLQFVNAAMADLLGYSTGEAEQTPFANYLVPEERAKVAARVDARLAGEDVPRIYETKLLHKDGTAVNVELSATAIQYRGNPADVVIVRDITERKQAEEALRTSEGFLSNIIDQSPYPMWIADGQGTLVRLNQACRNLIQISDEEVVGKYNVLKDSILEEQGLLPLIRRVFEWGETVRFEHSYDSSRLKDLPLKRSASVILDSTLFPIRDANERLTNVVIQHMDITERKRAEEALAESERRFFEFMEHLPACAFIKDQAGRVWFANRYLKDIFGWQEAYGKTTADLLPREVANQMIADDLKVLNEGPSVIREKIVDIHGMERFFDTYKFPLGIGDGPLMLGGISVDISGRKQAEEALRQSEEAYRLLFEQSVDGVIITVDGKIVEANSAFCAVRGAPLDEVMGLESITLIHPEDRDAAIRRVRSLQSGERLVESQIYRSAKFDDSPKWVELRSKLIKWGGQPAIQSIIRDITDQKRAEEALRESEERFRQTVEYLPLPVALVTDDGMVEYLNPKFIETFGYTLEDVPRLVDWYDLAYPDTAYRQSLKKEWEGALERVLASNEGTRSIDAEVVCMGGSKRIMNIMATTVGSKLLAIFTDLTERKQTENALRETNEALRTLIESAPIAIIAFDREGNVKLWNPAAEQMFGWRKDEVPGRFLPFISEEKLEEYEALSQRIFRGEVLTGVEIRRHRKDGSPIDLSISAAPLHDAQGEASGIMSVVADITERKRAREERTRLEAQMREVQKFESLGVLAGGIAHDFNNLLMAILGNAELALARLPSASTARHNITEITRASQRAADLCHQMLAYSGKGRYVVGRCDLSKIIREMAQIIEVSISKKAALRYSLARPLPPVEADATQMRQVVMNLITNASEALGDRSGIITVASGVVECDRPYLIEGHLDDRLPEGKYVTLEVSDTGYGMDADTLSKIFDPFFTTKFTGRGLGLAAVLGIVRGHKGAVQVSSELGKGTTFRVFLPAIEWLLGEMAQDEEQSVLPPHEGCILLIDDDPNVRDVSSEMLAMLGFRVLTASDGDEGLGVFRVHQDEIDCIILDLTMPRLGGEETFQELQQLRGDVPVILSSGYKEQEVTQRFVGKGLAGFVQKPYTAAKLLETLSRVLGRGDRSVG